MIKHKKKIEQVENGLDACVYKVLLLLLLQEEYSKFTLNFLQRALPLWDYTESNHQHRNVAKIKDEEPINQIDPYRKK